MKKIKITSVISALLFFTIIPLLSPAQTWIKSATTIPSSPGACDLIDLEIKGDLPASNYSYASSNVSQSGMHLDIDLHYNSSGIGTPVITPFTRVESIGILGAGNFTYTIYLFFNGNSADTYNGSFTVQAGGGSAGIVNDTTFCEGDSVTVDATVTGATSYSWYNGDTIATTNISTGGTFWVEVDFGSGCTVKDTFNVTSITLPQVDLGPDTSLCAESYLLDASVSGASYKWHNGSTAATFDAKQSGTFSVEVTKNTCSNSDTVDVILYDIPKVDLGPDTALCEGDSLVLTTNSGANMSYTWHDNSSDANYVVASSGTYWVEVESMDACTASDTIDAVFHPNPTVNLGGDVAIKAGDSTQLDAGVFAAYEWNTGDTGQVIWATIGSYSVTVTDENGCNGTDSVEVVLVQGVSERQADDLVIYPVPASDHLTISGMTQDGTITISDITGRTMMEMPVNGQGEISIDLALFPAGTYLVKVQSEGEVATRPVIIE